MDAYKVQVKLSRQEDGLWRAEAPDLPGCHVEGETLSGVIGDMQEAAALAIDYFKEAKRLSASISALDPDGASFTLPVVVGEHRFRRAKPRRGKVPVKA